MTAIAPAGIDSERATKGYQRAAEIGDRKSMTPSYVSAANPPASIDDLVAEFDRRQHHPRPDPQFAKRGIRDFGQRAAPASAVRLGTLRQGIKTAIAAAGIASERATRDTSALRKSAIENR